MTEVTRSGRPGTWCTCTTRPPAPASTRRTFYYYRNRVITVGKHYPFPFCLFEALGLMVLGFIRSLRAGQLGAFVKGVLWGTGRVLAMQAGRRPLAYGRFFRYYRFANPTCTAPPRATRGV